VRMESGRVVSNRGTGSTSGLIPSREDACAIFSRAGKQDREARRGEIPGFGDGPPTCAYSWPLARSSGSRRKIREH